MAIVVSHIGADFDRLAAQALRQAPLADVVELRLDRIGHPGADALRRFTRECAKPVIFTCRGPEGGGQFAGTVDEQLQLLVDCAANGARFVDVDWSLSLELGELTGTKCHRIVSRHDTEGTPDDLHRFLEDVRDVLYEGDITKIVTTAHRAADGLRVLAFLREVGGGLIAFSMGEAGAFTRVLAPIFGAAFTYAAPAHMPGEAPPEPTASGQLRVNDLVGLYPPGGPTPGTAVFAVVGDAVRDSWSPRVHGMALKAARLDAVYVALETDDFDELAALATDENLRGLSITAPFKGAARRLARAVDDASRDCDACNTLVRDAHGWRGANTDVLAVRETLEAALQHHAASGGRPATLAEARALVLGCGGAARAAALAVRSTGGRATLAGRDEDRARAAAAPLGCEAVAWSSIPEVEHDVLVNATPVGSLAAPGESPIPAEWLRPGTVVLDAVYRPLRTPLLLAARERGCTAVPGGEWFVRQAREQFRLLTGVAPDEPLLRAAFEHALEEDTLEPGNPKKDTGA